MEQQNQNQKEQPEVVVEQPKKKIIPTRLGLLVILLTATIAGAGAWWYAVSYNTPQELLDMSGVVEQVKKDDIFTNFFPKVQYRKTITFSDIGNEESLLNHQVFIKLDTLSLIEEEKLSFDCGDLYFTDTNGDTKIPFWMKEDQCRKKEARIWLNIPNIEPHEEKVVYIFYGNRNIASESSFEKVFPQQNTSGLTAAYFFASTLVEKDFSGYMNDSDYRTSYYTDYADFGGGIYNTTVGPFFNHWGCDQYDSICDTNRAEFTAPSLNNVDFSQGAIEMWINPYIVVSENYQKIIMDSGGAIELGIQPDGDLYFYPSQAGGKNYNLIKNTFKRNKWTHIVVTWDFETKESIFYINGEKRKNDIENISTNWTEKTKIGDKWKIAGFAYAGYIDGLRIYNKVLSAEEIRISFEYGKSLGVNVVIGDEEILKDETEQINFSESVIEKSLSVTDQINIDSSSYKYAGSGECGSRWADEESEYMGYLYEDKPIYLLPKRGTKKIPIFGYPSHFYSYEGTNVSFEDPFLLSYVGFNTNNPDLIKKLDIELKELAFVDPLAKNGWLDGLTPIAYACGPYNAYYSVGESELTFVKEQDSVFWYELEAPIFVNKQTGMMQVYYLPSGVEGFLSLQLADMIFQNKTKSFVRPIIYSHSGLDKEYYYSSCSSEAYYAYLSPEEKGSIIFKQDKESKELFLSFENKGDDAFMLDENSFKSIQTIFDDDEEITSFNIRNEEGEMVYSLPMESIKKDILGKTIEPSSALSVSVPLHFLENNMSYWITLGRNKNTAFSLNQEQRKVIHWTFGESAYSYAPIIWDDRALYRLSVDDLGIMTLDPNVRVDNL